jgi:hypothetical protein
MLSKRQAPQAGTGRVVEAGSSYLPVSSQSPAGCRPAGPRRCGAGLRPGRCPPPVDQAVRVLHAGHARQAVLLRPHARTRPAPRAFIAQADVAHLARLHQAGQRAAAGRGWRCAGPWRGRSTGAEDRPRCGWASGSGTGRSHRSAAGAGCRHRPGRCGRAAGRRAVAHPGHAARRPGHLGGQHHRWRTPGRRPATRPMMVSVAPKVSRRAGTAYISAVSMKLMPPRRARGRGSRARGSSTCSPKVMVPRQMGLTRRSLLPHPANARRHPV